MVTITMSGNSSTISINGSVYSGNYISVSDGKVFVDGKKQPQQLEGNVSIVVHGRCDLVEAQSGDIVVNGSVSGDVKTLSGDVRIDGDVGGDVKTLSGDVRIDGDVHHE